SNVAQHMLLICEQRNAVATQNTNKRRSYARSLNERNFRGFVFMYQFILIIHILAAVCIVGLVLVQQGKGATMGAAFGSGASQTVFGSRGSGSFLLKVTIGLAILFFATSITLTNIATKLVKSSTEVSLPIELPAAPAQKPAAPLQPSSVTPNQIPDMPIDLKELTEKK
ncbi:MAG TPA: preprotein translocase subunit SecG, partial [Gammaproteobacteria bacterium]|nr:preprotein translocase subunit SecG [Gammaproteobacteria bacterium]